MALERAVPGDVGWERLCADHLARYFFAADFTRGKRVLDAGTGMGYGAVLLKAAGGAARVQAVDIDAPTIEGVRQRFAGDGVEFFVDDCEKLLNVAAPVDVICSFENIEHLRDPKAFVAAAARVLADDGLLLCSTPDRATAPPFVGGKPANPFHVHEWYRQEFIDLLAPHFGEVEARVQVHSAAAEAREQAALALEQHLAYLWANPIQRLGRALRALAGKRRPWPQIRPLGAASPGDFPILHASVAPFVGKAWCHFALCRKPRR